MFTPQEGGQLRLPYREKSVAIGVLTVDLALGCENKSITARIPKGRGCTPKRKCTKGGGHQEFGVDR